MSDFLIVGGGVIGLSIAYELAGQGAAVTVIDQTQLGREASWAGAGMLPPGDPEHAADPYTMLRAVGHRMWQKLSEQLRGETGIDNGYRQSGCIEVRLAGAPDQLREEIQLWRSEGVQVEELTSDALAMLEPRVNQSAVAAYRLPEMSQVRNPRHVNALIAACGLRGVTFIEGQPVVEFEQRQGRMTALRTPSDLYRASTFCIASGAWTRRLVARAGCDIPVAPVRGQIVLLSTTQLPFRHMIQTGPRYLVPRDDGRILVGSTEENAGFDKRNTAAAVHGLIEMAIDLVPALAAATCERTWAGLRPGSADGMPYLGRLPGHENAFVAAGHFRSGLQLSPATALVMRELMLGQKLTIPLDAFACDRHSSIASESSS